MKFQDDSKNRARKGKSQRARLSIKARVLGKRDHRQGELELKTSSGIATVGCLWLESELSYLIHICDVMEKMKEIIIWNLMVLFKLYKIYMDLLPK